MRCSGAKRARVWSKWWHGAALIAAGALSASASVAQELVHIDQFGANDHQIVSGLQNSSTQFDPVIVSSGSSAVSGIFQAGTRNLAVSFINRSPGNTTEQVQFGDDNVSIVGMEGGGANAVGVVQAGSNFVSQIFIKDSVGTRVAHVQTPGKLPYARIIILNAQPGTTVTIK